MNPSTARHLSANLLHSYAEMADTQDIDAVVALLGDAEVHFPSGGYDRPEDARPFFERIWSARTTQRHDVTNLVVEPDGHGWRARAHYVRWRYEDEAAVHTLGRYEMLLATSVDALVVRRFTVVRQWSRA